MTLAEYQAAARRTAVYPDIGSNLVYPVLGLNGEAGEVAEVVKRIARDDCGALTPRRKEQLAGELGDVLWYLAQIATEAGLSLDTIAIANLEKLRDRQQRQVLRGSGDAR